MVDPPAKVPWRMLGVFVLVPNVFYGIGMGAIIPITPIYATHLGASVASAALVSAMLLIGQVVTIPAAGWLVGRLGERTAMLLASVLSTAGAGLCMASTTPAVLGVGVFMVGAAVAVFGLARHAFVTVIAPVSARGRALSVVAGSNRLGVLIGPFLTAAVIGLTGSVRAAFVVVVASSALLGIAVLIVRLPRHAGGGATPGDPTGPRPGILRTVRARHDVLLRVGAAAALITMTRTSRQIIVPLWAIEIGIRDIDISLIVGVASAVDFLLFYLGGQIMDHFGRLWSAMPPMLVFGVGHVVLAFSGQLGSPGGWFIAVTMLFAVGNGISSGIVAALGSDLADPANPSAFLTSWRFVIELGPASAPLVIAAVTATASLAAAAIVMGAISFVGAGALLRYLPRHLPHTARKLRSRPVNQPPGSPRRAPRDQVRPPTP